MNEPADETLHPGIIFKERIIKGNRLSVSNTAKLLEMHRTSIYQIIKKQNGLSADICQRIAVVFGENAEDWAKLQSDYDLAIARQKVAEMNLKPFRPDMSPKLVTMT